MKKSQLDKQIFLNEYKYRIWDYEITHKLYLKHTIRKERLTFMAGESTELLKEWHVSSRCWTSLSFYKFQRYVRRWNNLDVRSIAIYEPRSPTDEIARNKWKTTILKMPVCCLARVWRVCASHALMKFTTSPPRRTYTRYVTFLLIPPSPLFSRRDLDRQSLQARFAPRIIQW